LTPVRDKPRSSETTLPSLSFAWPWLLGFVLTVYLGLSGGGFDPLDSLPAGIAIWWILVLGVAVGALPRRRPGPLALAALALLAAFALWTGLSLRWTESSEKTALEVAQVGLYLGAFALAVLSRGREGARQMVGALAAGIAVIAGVALLSRLHPAWFPAAQETGRFLETGKERLSYPLDYWNALAALIGIGIALMLQVATGAKAAAVRALATAALPAMILAIYFTLSRGGIAAAAIAIALYFALVPDRLPRLLTATVVGVGGGALILLASHRYELVHGIAGSTARSQGTEMTWLTLAVCVLAGLAQLALGATRRPQWAHVSPRSARIATGAAAAIAVVALLAAGAPGKVNHAWHDFKQPTEESAAGTSRLGSTSGENRYQLWSAAVREFDSAPLAGTGANTFQLWWTRDADVEAPTLDTHSLYLQTLGELGIVGLAILGAFIALALAGGVIRVIRSGEASRAYLAAALAASSVIWTTSVFDWTWKLPIVPIAALLLIAVLLTAGDPEPEPERDSALAWPWRVGVAAASLAAIAFIAIPYAGTSLIRQSQDKAREGDLNGALADARSAQNVQPGAATPRLQEALILEEEGKLPAAGAAARAATEREPTNWRTWLVLSRLEAELGNAAPAVRDYRRARSLNPESPIFDRRG
jgi:O-Antigen ligase